MVSETYKNSQDQALEERLSNMHEQMAGVTSRLDQTERALDLERATREDIIKAEVERRMREAEQRIRKEIEAEYGLYRFCPWIAHAKTVSQISPSNGTLFKIKV